MQGRIPFFSSVAFACFVISVPFANDPHGAKEASPSAGEGPSLDAAPFVVGSAAGEQISPSITSDGQGGAFVAWLDTRSGGGRIYASHILSSGRTAEQRVLGGEPVADGSGAQAFVRTASDGIGGAFLVWADARNDDGDLYAQRLTPTGLIATGWPAGGRAVSRVAGLQKLPMVASDQRGGILIAWEDHRHGKPSVCVHRIGRDGAPPPGWDANGTFVTATRAEQRTPALLADGAGGAFVAWEDRRDGVARVRLHHFNALGEPDPAWPSQGVFVRTGRSLQTEPRVAADGVGGVYVGWVDRQSGADRVLVQRVNRYGLRQWAAAGVPVAAATGRQHAPVLLPVEGGLMVAWEDERGQDSDVYAQRVAAQGYVTAGWPAEGFAACAAAGEQVTPQLLEDGAGGALALWVDHRGGAPRVYTLRVTPDGHRARGWPLNGASITSLPAFQHAPVAVSHGSKGATLVWSEGASDPDVVGGNISTGAPVEILPPPADAAGPPLVLALDGFRPNPAMGDVRVALTLPDAADAVLEVFDVAGRRVARRALADLGPGRHVVRLDPRERLAPGAYTMRLVRGAKTITARGTILR